MIAKTNVKTDDKKKMNIFNPFEDRLCRDIRNALSSAFAASVESGETSRLELALEEYTKKELGGCYQEYLESRSRRYSQVLEKIQGIHKPLEQAVIVWNHELFFEVHELLEHEWYEAQGEYRQTLQAMIRAAGTYVKMECGYLEAARKIANKAWPILERNYDLLKDYFEPTPLIEALKNPEPVAPKLS